MDKPCNSWEHKLRLLEPGYSCVKVICETCGRTYISSKDGLELFNGINDLAPDQIW